MSPIDYSAWTRPLDQAEYREFVSRAKAAQQQPESDGPGSLSTQRAMSVALVSAVLGALVVALSLLNVGVGNGMSLTVAGFAVAAFLIGGAVYLAARNCSRFWRRWQLYYRANEFAQDNRLEFSVTKAAPEYDGMLFRMPAEAHRADYVFTGRLTSPIEAGQLCHTYTVPNTRNNTRTRRWGYIAIELSTAAPARAVLRSSDKGSDTVMALRFAQSVGSATPLTAVHTLYCPPESSAVASEVFNAELMATIESLEQKYGPVNAELVGDHLYVFTPKAFDMYDAETVRLVFDTIAAALPAALHGAE